MSDLRITRNADVITISLPPQFLVLCIDEARRLRDRLGVVLGDEIEEQAGDGPRDVGGIEEED